MDPLLGQIQLFAFGFVPSYWMMCDGRILNVSAYQALFSLIGNKFGGNGSTTFALPNLNTATPFPGMVYCISVQGIYPSRP